MSLFCFGNLFWLLNIALKCQNGWKCFNSDSLWGAEKYLFDTHKLYDVGYPNSIWISKSPSHTVCAPRSLFSLCAEGFSLRGTDSVDVHWSLWHTLRTPTGLSVHPSGPRPAHKTETHVSCSSDSLTRSSYLVWCNEKFSIATSWAFDASEQVDVCAVEMCWRWCSCCPYWRGPGIDPRQ